MDLRRQLVGIEERHGAAHDLLGAAERIAVECGEQRCHVERGRRGDRQRELAAPRHQIGEHVGRESEHLAGVERLHGATRQDLRRCLDRQRIVPLDREAFGPGDLHRHRAGANAARGQRQAQTAALLGLELQRPVARGDAERTVGRDHHMIVARLALHIVEIEPDRARVPEQHEARQRGGDHHGIAHHDVG